MFVNKSYLNQLVAENKALTERVESIESLQAVVTKEDFHEMRNKVVAEYEAAYKAKSPKTKQTEYMRGLSFALAAIDSVSIHKLV